MTRSFFEFARLLGLGGHDEESRLSNGSDTCFLNIAWPHRPPCLTSGSQQGSISHHGNRLRVPDQPNGTRGKTLVRVPIGISAPFRYRIESLTPFLFPSLSPSPLDRASPHPSQSRQCQGRAYRSPNLAPRLRDRIPPLSAGLLQDSDSPCGGSGSLRLLCVARRYWSARRRFELERR